MKHQLTIFLLIVYVKLVQYTSRKKLHHPQNLKKAKELSEHGNYAVAAWHQDLNTIMFSCEKPFTTMGSRSKDGELAVRAGASVGVSAVRGSSSSGGEEAMHEMIDLINKNHVTVGLTVDGPRGPARVPKMGVFAIARMTNIPVVPYISISSRRKTLERSWDKTRVPLPFGTIHHAYGEPIMIESLDKKSLKAYSQHVIDQIEALEKELLTIV